ncbi:MAG TPA: hypothetical protein VI248_14230 [Kineosporiaceae bacterium]
MLRARRIEERAGESMQGFSGEVPLTKIFEECIGDPALAPHIEVVRKWALEYLCAPHPDLGRGGPVCPFTSSSLSKELFWLGCVDDPTLDAGRICGIMDRIVERYATLEAPREHDALLKTVLVLFPGVKDFGIIDAAQLRLKSKFVAQGLMIGQFYPGCAEPGLWSKSFHPLDSPIPLLAIRHMVSSDFPFLAHEARWVESYFRRFAPSIPAPVRDSIVAKLTEPGETYVSDVRLERSAKKGSLL